MSDERKPSEDAKEGLGLLLRAATKLARGVERELKQDVDVSKLAREAGALADKASTELLRAASAVGREIDRAATNAARAKAASVTPAPGSVAPPADAPAPEAHDASTSEPAPPDDAARR